jgi:hypothetical protein
LCACIPALLSKENKNSKVKNFHTHEGERKMLRDTAGLQIKKKMRQRNVLLKIEKLSAFFIVDYGGFLSVLNFLQQHLGLIKKREFGWSF